MSELKTLKDLEGRKDYDFHKDWLYNRSELKEEAIKWIKHFKEAKKKAISQNQLLDEHNLCEEYFKKGKMFDEKIEDWKHFFNITEEDLK